MTFLFHPHRSSSDEELLDQQLNEWVGGSDAKHTGDVDSDPIAFHRWADETRRSEPAATGPAAGTWNRVLRQTAQPQSKGTSTMSTAALGTGYTVARPDSIRERVSRFTHLAATIALVLAVAVGGWFAMSQMPGRDGNSRFAAIQSTPGDSAQTCDVEPMTVDEVLEKIEHPFGNEESEQTYPEWIQQAQRHRVLWVTGSPLVPNNYIDQSLIESFQNQPEEESFEIATERMNSFLACAQSGTIGQALWYLRPFEIQRIVLSDLPLYRDKATVTDEIEKLLPMPASGLVSWSDSAFTNPNYEFQANSNISSAASSNIFQPTQYGASEAIIIGITVSDQNGEVVFQNDSQGVANPAGPLLTTDRFRVIMAESLVDEQWYVLAIIPE